MNWTDPPEVALEQAFVEALYDRLRRLARRQLGRESQPPTLQATALVHEAWLRLAGGAEQDWASRAHVYNAAALAMRRILVDRARRRQSARHGAEVDRVSIELAESVAEEQVDMLRLDEALERLEAMDARAHQVVHLRFFVGLSVAETAELTGLSTRTVKREWRAARLWLFDRLVRERQPVPEDEGDERVT